jgi:FMN phosphatase YigB (HAD superfamily)
MREPTPVLPEVLAQIKTLPASKRPLIVCDVDEVVLHMISHLEEYLHARELMFLKYEYRLTGNIAGKADRQLLSTDEVRRHLLSFFDEISHSQDMVPGATEALNTLAANWDIVFLTNLPGGHNKPVREQLLAGLGLPFPVLTNSGPKGGAVAALASGRPAPVVFIDDSPTNHASVHATLPSAVQIQFIADRRFLETSPRVDHIDLLTGDWQETAAYISDILV